MQARRLQPAELLPDQVKRLKNLEAENARLRRGRLGRSGGAGKAGEPGKLTQVKVGEDPTLGPGGNGGAGGAGGVGGDGGNVVIRYASAASAPTASAQGALGGAGGVGGKGGTGNPPGKAGPDGAHGASGKPGTVSITQVAAGEVFTGLEADWLNTWSDYRTQVGEYLFRLFDSSSLVQAQAEFTAALQLNRANTTAPILLGRLVQQETPTGISRHLDMAPDYGALSASLLSEAQLVVSEFMSLQNTATQAQIAQAALNELQLQLNQLQDRLTESKDDLTTANTGIQVAAANLQVYQSQIGGLQKQLNSLENQSFNWGSLLTTVGDVASAIGNIVTIVGGIAALAIVKKPAVGAQPANSSGSDANAPSQGGGGYIVSIPSALAAPDQTAGVLEVNSNDVNITINNSNNNQGGFGKDLSGVLSGTGGAITNLTKVYNDIFGSSNDAAINQVLAQLALLTLQGGVAVLRAQQAQDALAAAQQRVTDYTNEVGTASGMVSAWSQDAASLNQAVNQMIPMAQAFSDKVANDIFIARRALEIYQLEDASSAHFDYGWLHPDQDSSLKADATVQGTVLRAQQYLQKIVSNLPTDVVTWNDIYTALNVTGTSGFDIVHPDIEVTIDDPAALMSLKSGAGILFSVGIGPDPTSVVKADGVYELKVNSLSLELTGASQSSPASLWIQHSGHWIMTQPPAGSPPTPQQTEFMLFPHVEIFNLQAGTGSLTAQIPEQPSSSVNPGPPFSFWGRGLMADWYLYAESTNSALDLSGLTAVKLTIGSIGLVPQGAASPGPIVLKPAAVAFKQLVSVPTLALAGAAH
jgi:hypothetical protein